MSHAISAERFARVVAGVYESDLDWDNPSEYDLLDHEELTESARKILAALTEAGFVVARDVHGPNSWVDDTPVGSTAQAEPPTGAVRYEMRLYDHDHKPKQHRDGKPPWCKVCGLTAEGTVPVWRAKKES